MRSYNSNNGYGQNHTLNKTERRARNGNSRRYEQTRSRLSLPNEDIDSANTGPSKREHLEAVAHYLDADGSSALTLQRTNLTPSFSIDERGFVYFARHIFNHLRMLDVHSDQFCSEFEFVVYSLIILRVQQVQRYGVRNIEGVQPSEASDFVAMMTGRSYPKVFDEYFRCLGTVTTNGGFPIDMKLKLEEATDAELTLSGENSETSKSQESAHTRIDLEKLDKLLEHLHLDDFEPLLKRHFPFPAFSTISRGGSINYRGANYTSEDPHFQRPFHFVNVRLLNNVSTYLSFVSGKYQLADITNRAVSMSVPAEYDKVAQIRVRDPSDYCGSVFLTMREAQTAPSTMLAAMFQLYTDDNHDVYPSAYADNGYFALTVVGVHALFEKLAHAYNVKVIV